MKCILKNTNGQEVEAFAKFECGRLKIVNSQKATMIDLYNKNIKVTRENDSQVILDESTEIEIIINNKELPVEVDEQLIQFTSSGLDAYFENAVNKE